MPEDRAFSCVIPVYNNFDCRRTRLSLSSVLAQDCRDKEVIVVECNQEPTLESIGTQEGVKYVFVEGRAPFNTGMIRNVGVLASTRPFLYLLDSDIVLQRSDFLTNVGNALSLQSDLILRRPPMRRLWMDSFDEFWCHHAARGLRSAIDSLDKSSPHVATLGAPPPALKLVCPPGKEGSEAWTTTEELYRLYKSRPELKDLVPLIFCGTRHWGGVALRRAHFEHVGGYAHSFRGWGNEDTDLQWKLGECFNLEFFPDTTEFEVLHLDHEKPYFVPEKWRKNKAQADARLARGLSSAIEQDRFACESLRRQANG